MRISEIEREAVVGPIRALDGGAKIWLFGSRADDAGRGGDIDIAILSEKIGRTERMRLRRAILDQIGEQRLDIVVSADGKDPFFRLALEKGIRIDE